MWKARSPPPNIATKIRRCFQRMPRAGLVRRAYSLLVLQKLLGQAKDDVIATRERDSGGLERRRKPSLCRGQVRRRHDQPLVFRPWPNTPRASMSACSSPLSWRWPGRHSGSAPIDPWPGALTRSALAPSRCFMKSDCWRRRAAIPWRCAEFGFRPWLSSSFALGIPSSRHLPAGRLSAPDLADRAGRLGAKFARLHQRQPRRHHRRPIAPRHLWPGLLAGAAVLPFGRARSGWRGRSRLLAEYTRPMEIISFFLFRARFCGSTSSITWTR